MSGDVELNPGPQGNEKYLCPLCGKSFSCEADLQKHTMQAHDDRTFTCDICQNTILGKKGLQNHMRSHQEIRCNLCQNDFKAGSFYKHKAQCGKNIKPEVLEIEFKCDNCPYISQYKHALKRHGYKTVQKGTEAHAKKQHKSTVHFNAKNLGDF